MPTTLVRASTHAHETLARIAKERRTTMARALDALVEEHERRAYFETLAAAYAAHPPDADPAYRADVAALDGALGDNLEPEDWRAEYDRTRPQ